MKLQFFFSVMLALLIVAACSTHHNKPIIDDESGPINLIVRADDIGSCHAANLACIAAYRDGIVRSVEVMVPCPWFLEAAEMLRENQGLDVGVHLTLNSEWKNYKWGALTNGKTLVDENGYFYSRTEQFKNAGIDLNELETELRAQIEMALKYIPQVSHLSSHMNTCVAEPEYRAIVEKLSAEYNLPMSPKNLTDAFEFWEVPFNEKEKTLVKKLNELTPGTWLFVCHPAYKAAETRALSGINTDYDADIHMAEHRDVVAKLMKSERIKKIIQKRNIRLLSYADTFTE